MDLLIAPFTVTKEQADTAPTTGTPGWATDGNPATSKPATQWPAYAFNAMQEELVTVIQGSGLALDRNDNTLLLQAVRKLVTAALTGVAGSASNLRCAVSVASASATFTADEIVVSTALGGPSYRLSNFNKTLNISTTGAGGMDTGAPPATGWVAVYAIYNPTTGASSILARNATAAAQPTVYGGANMPAGYTASALISVWPVVSSVLTVAFQTERTVSYFTLVYTGAGFSSFTAVSLANSVPRNAKTANMNSAVSSTVAGFISSAVCATQNGLGTPGYSSIAGYTPGGGASIVGHFHDVPLISAQSLYLANGGASLSTTFNCYGYTF